MSFISLYVLTFWNKYYDETVLKHYEAERLLYKELLLKGWIKAPLKRGDGLRYYDGKGNAISLNKGYPDRLRSGDAIHGKPYAK